jgi:hypothetical protein
MNEMNEMNRSAGRGFHGVSTNPRLQLHFVACATRKYRADKAEVKTSVRLRPVRVGLIRKLPRLALTLIG